jgi:hypothetical protein
MLVEVTKSGVNALSTISLQDKSEKAIPLVGEQSSGFPTAATLSTDGRWVAYESNMQLFVQPLPGTGVKYLIHSRSSQPLWSPDGRELFFFNQLGEFSVVSVTTQPSFNFGNPVPGPRGGWRSSGSVVEREYDITPDGKRFIGVIDAGGSSSGASTAPQIQVVLNWFEELRQRVPTR